ncbi:MAG: helix-turn-helix domain-containing protein [Candidatus Woesearchaeota archaeon]
MNTKSALQEYGLSDKEANVYLTLLPLGSVNLQEVARRVNYPRTTVYNTLNYLLSKGLVSKIIKKGITFYSAVDPDKIKDKLEEKKKVFESALPELKLLASEFKQSSSVQIYEGFRGIYTLLWDVFNKKQMTYYFGGYTKSLETLKHLPAQSRMLRLERKIPAKIIIDKANEEIFHRADYKKITEMRILPSLKDFPCMVFIYGEKVAMYTVTGDLIGIIIHNKQFSQAMRIIFEMYWKTAKSLRK